MAIRSPDYELIGAALFFSVITIACFCLQGHEAGQKEALKRRIHDRTLDECKLFFQKEDELRELLAAGKLSFLVEWWEEDNPFIDENGHILFLFNDGTSMDFVLHQPTVEKLTPILNAYQIKWEWRRNARFDSQIIYPPQYAGQKFYTPDGSPRPDIKL